MRVNDERVNASATSNVAELRPRERQAQMELGTTRFASGTRLVIVALFIAIIGIVPIYEAITDVRENQAARSRMLAEGVAPALLPGRRPQVIDALNLLPRLSDIRAVRSLSDARNLIARPAAIREFENRMQLHSAAGRLMRPWFQAALTSWLGSGNDRVVVARDGYMYYADGVRYVSGAGFLDSARINRERVHGFEPDARPAIYQMHNALKALGIQLVVLTLPDKATIHPEALASNLQVSAPVQNSSWPQFVRDLRAHGVTVVDPTQAMFDADKRGTEQFLPLDTHWNVAGMNTTLDALTHTLDSLGVTKGGAGYTTVAHTYDRAQDLVTLLDLPASVANVEHEHLNMFVPQVRDGAGQLWASDSSSDMVFVGDSFFELFSTYPGEEKAASGFVEQMSFRLQRSIERHANQSYGKYDTREPLGTSLEELRRHMRGKKVVVWEFAMRKLMFSTWPLLPNEPER